TGRAMIGKKVEYYEYEHFEDKPSERVSKGPAEFLGFGIDYEEVVSGAGIFSTAIILFGDGTVKNVSLEMIKFIG
ncbi:unnamed protein product, partial [marine sediment metagenome]